MDRIPVEEPSEFPPDLARRLGLRFENMDLLSRALTHRSFVNEHPEVLDDNERLEFLGDAVLDFMVGAWLYNRFPEVDEGQLTRMRSILVRTEQLADFARSLDLGPALRLGRGEVQAGGRRRSLLLGSAFEALVGAIYLQSGVEAVDKFIQPFLEASREKIVSRPELPDPKSRLQEWSQQHELGLPAYHTIQISGPEHDYVFEVEVHVNGQTAGRGKGHTRQAAERDAAQQALDSFELH
jgi:ribonuclease-3